MKKLVLLVLIGMLISAGGCVTTQEFMDAQIQEALDRQGAYVIDLSILDHWVSPQMKKFVKEYTILKGSPLSPGGVKMETQAERPEEISFEEAERNWDTEWSTENKTIMNKLRAIENAPTMMGATEAALEFFDYIEKQMDAINFD